MPAPSQSPAPARGAWSNRCCCYAGNRSGPYGHNGHSLNSGRCQTAPNVSDPTGKAGGPAYCDLCRSTCRKLAKEAAAHE